MCQISGHRCEPYPLDTIHSSCNLACQRHPCFYCPGPANNRTPAEVYLSQQYLHNTIADINFWGSWGINALPKYVFHDMRLPITRLAQLAQYVMMPVSMHLYCFPDAPEEEDTSVPTPAPNQGPDYFQKKAHSTLQDRKPCLSLPSIAVSHDPIMRMRRDRATSLLSYG